MSPGDYHIAQAIGMRGQEPEDRPDTSSGRSDDEGHRGEAKQAATFVCNLSVVVRIMVHGRSIIFEGPRKGQFLSKSVAYVPE
jgi:hypothetical protein